MKDQWRVVVISSNRSTWENLSRILSGLHIDSSWVSSVEECSHIFRRDTVDLIFCDERLSDGDYWDVYSAVTCGLIRKPKVVLMSRSMDVTECEQAKCCGIFAVIESPTRRASVEWSVLLAKKAARSVPKAAVGESIPKFDIFSGAPDRNAAWVCAVRGLANAKERMDEIAAERPGRYFLFYAPDRSILAQTETFAKPERRREAQNESA